MQKAKYGLIISAGNQKRFKADTPKSLVIIENDTCLLDISIERLSPYCEEVYVVCSYDNEEWFDDDKYDRLVISSGLGSGDAIFKALKLLDHEKEDKVIIQWGDSLINEDLYPILLEYDDDKCFVPCAYEDDPYVQVIQNENDTVSVLFSKYQDTITAGFHDMSVFFCKIRILCNHLQQFCNAFYVPDKQMYSHKHRNEFEFLDVFNDTDIKTQIVEIDSSLQSYSFNTVDELKDILADISKN